MKYVSGDRVRIVKGDYQQDIRDGLLSKRWIVTIKDVIEDGDIYPERYYTVKEFPCKWLPRHIEDYENPIKKRFEILDL